MDDMDDFIKPVLITIVASIIIVVLLFGFLYWYGVTHPMPSNREICENNGGTYVQNYSGKAGSFCIYNKGGDKQ